jgi:hypothetical protein
MGGNPQSKTNKIFEEICKDPNASDYLAKCLYYRADPNLVSIPAIGSNL